MKYFVVFFSIICFLSNCKDPSSVTTEPKENENIVNGIRIENGSEKGDPNIVLILTDDLGFNDFQRHFKIKSHPVIEKFIAESFEITNFNTNSNCSPSRHALLTGNHSFKYGMNSFVVHPYYKNYHLTETDKIFPEILQEHGYTNGIFGKWHLADTSEGVGKKGTMPLDRGFDVQFGVMGGGIHYFKHHHVLKKFIKGKIREVVFKDISLDQKPIPLDDSESVTKLLTDHAIDFISENHKKNNKFFAYLPYTAPHTPYNRNPYDTHFYFSKCHDKKLRAKDIKRFYVLEQLIENIERVIVTLKELNIEDNTILIVTSDNGAVGRQCKSKEFNSPLKGFKGSLYDLSLIHI